MSPEKEKQKKQFKKKKRKRRKIKNMKGMIASFIIAFLLISAFYVFLWIRNPMLSDDNTIPVSGRVVSVTADSRPSGRYGSQTWVTIEFDNGEQYDILLDFLKDVGFASTEDFRNRIIYKKATIRYRKNDIPSIYSLNYNFVYLKIGSDVIIDYNLINDTGTRNAILVGICFLVLLGIVDVFIWLSYGKHRVG